MLKTKEVAAMKATIDKKLLFKHLYEEYSMLE
jgi:hypothetical protein